MKAQKTNHWNELKKNLRKHPKFIEAVKEAQALKNMFPEASRGITAENMVTTRIALCEIFQGQGFQREIGPNEEIDISDIEALAEELRRTEQVQK